MDVVRVDDPGAAAAHHRRDLVGIQPAGEQTGRCPSAPETLARALHDVDLVSAPRQQRGQVSHRALLTASRAVAVVEDEDHAPGEAPGLCTRTAGADGLGTSSFGANAASAPTLSARAGSIVQPVRP